MDFESGQFIKTRRNVVVGKIVKVFKSHSDNHSCVGFVTLETDAIIYRPFSDVVHLSKFDTWCFKFFGVLAKLNTKFSNYMMDETLRSLTKRIEKLERKI